RDFHVTGVQTCALPILVIDNGTSSETRDFIASLDYSFPVWRLDGTSGAYAEARNLGVAKARWPIVAFIDDDCEADKLWLERLVRSEERRVGKRRRVGWA